MKNNCCRKTHAILQKNNTLVSKNVGNRTQPVGQGAQRTPSIPSVKTNYEKEDSARAAGMRSCKKHSTLVSRNVGNRTQPVGQDAQRAPSIPSMKPNSEKGDSARDPGTQHAELQERESVCKMPSRNQRDTASERQNKKTTRI